MQDVDSNQSKDTGERPSASLLSAEPGLAEVIFDRNMFDMPVMIGLMVLVFIVGWTPAAVLLSILLKAVVTPAMKQVIIAATLVALLSLLWALVLKSRKRNADRVRQALEESAGSPIETRISQILGITRSLYPQDLVREAAKTLVAEGCLGTAIRIAPVDQATGIDPIAVPFEPRRFDELAEVDSAEPSQTKTETDNDGEARDRERAASPATVPRGIRRNLMLKGGWVVLVVLGFNWVARAIESWQRRTITPFFMFMTVVLLALLLLPAGQNLITGRQWLAVPAGIVLRKGKWLKRRWDLHLFGRGGSVLVVYKLYRRQWVLVVANRDACESTLGTKQELDAVLRAWLSPLAPPTLEQLSDLR